VITSDRWQQIEAAVSSGAGAPGGEACGLSGGGVARDEVLRHEVAALLAAPPTVDGVFDPAIAAVAELVTRAGLEPKILGLSEPR
jgi:hypothetical protein